MTLLLDQFRSKKGFRPATAIDLFALRLAQKLDDAPAVQHYVTLAQHHTEFQLLCAYRRAVRNKHFTNLGRCFHDELARTHGNGHQNGSARLISVRIERRTVAAAVFDGSHLEYADARQISSSRGKALASAVGFIVWMLNRFPVESAALEEIPNGNEIQRRVLHDAISGVLRDRILPIWEVPRDVLLHAYGQPPLKARAELRDISTAIWPILAGTHAKVFMQDAAALGLHVQTERLFIIQ